jgi:hypothetical protein
MIGSSAGMSHVSISRCGPFGRFSTLSLLGLGVSSPRSEPDFFELPMGLDSVTAAGA